MYSRRLYSAALMENQATSTMILYPTQSYYPSIELCPILLMPITRRGKEKYQFINFISHWLDSTGNWTPALLQAYSTVQTSLLTYYENCVYFSNKVISIWKQFEMCLPFDEYNTPIPVHWSGCKIVLPLRQFDQLGLFFLDLRPSNI